MITVKFFEIRSGALMMTLQKLMHQNFKSIKTSYRISRIAKALEQEAATVHEQFLKLLKQYAELDEKGNFVPISEAPEHKGSFKIPDDKKEAWEKAAEEFAHLTFEIDRWKIPVEWLINETGLQLSPVDLSMLETILCEEDEEPKKPALKSV